ncbi:glycosyltransferase family 2 protein [Baekduia soli]|uniref:glycosyltransferase family 2 protein n=1 Tax=Baekduia soli TaxID=496014 RepID=UPI001E635ED3|nr:glycosyltransferase [Baekduia soli]
MLVPAHDEAGGIADTVRSLTAQDHPADLRETIVIADNCSDATARVAADAGATVWERIDPERRGKGQALAWAIGRLTTERPAADAVAIVDADCIASENLLGVMAGRLAAADAAVQCGYVVANAEASPESALRTAGFLLMHDVRAGGKQALGLSTGLFGTGMAFAMTTLRRVPWESTSITEDTEYHLRLIDAGLRVAYAGDAHVASEMPTSAAAAREQHLRWEGGNAALARGTAPRLLAKGIMNRSPQHVHAALERWVPPQSLLLAATLAATAGSAVSGSSRGRRFGLATLAGQGLYVVGGLVAARAPSAVWRALVHAPRLVLRRLAVMTSMVRRGAPTEWVRTAREHESPRNPPSHDEAGLGV